MPTFIYLLEDSQLGKIKLKLELCMWHGFRAIQEPVILRGIPDDVTSEQERILEQLQVIKHQVVKFILEFQYTPYLKKFLRPFFQTVNGLYEVFSWMRRCATV